MQIISSNNHLHEMSKPDFLENLKKKKKNHYVVCWKFYP